MAVPIVSFPRDSRFIDLTGRRFGRLVVVAYAANCNNNAYWLCKCDCGMEKLVGRANLSNGHVRSCGCLRAELEASGGANKLHGFSRWKNGKQCFPPEYAIWSHMRSRCRSLKDKAYDRYGGRGIKVCDRWLNGENGKHGFLCFLEDVGTRPSRDHSLDRIDNDGNYEPGNCRWATKQEQASNRRSTRFVIIRGERMTITEAIRRSGFTDTWVYRQINLGVPLEIALRQKHLS